MKLYLPFKELTLPENAYDPQLHRHLLETVDALADSIPPCEAFETEVTGQVAQERYGYGGMVYLPYGWYHPSWMWPVLQEKESRGKPVKKQNPLRTLAYVYRYDADGQVVSIEYYRPKQLLREAVKFVTYFVRQDDVTAMYTFSDWAVVKPGMHLYADLAKAKGDMRLYSVAWVDHTLKRQHIVKANWHTGSFKTGDVSTEIIYTLQINGKTYCDGYVYDAATKHLNKSTMDYELLDVNKL